MSHIDKMLAMERREKITKAVSVTFLILIAVALMWLIASVTMKNDHPPAPVAPLQEQKIWDREHTIPNGETLQCVQVTGTGIDCNWEAVNG